VEWISPQSIKGKERNPAICGCPAAREGKTSKADYGEAVKMEDTDGYSYPE
jgi:hypothetical protein